MVATIGENSRMTPRFPTVACIDEVSSMGWRIRNRENSRGVGGKLNSFGCIVFEATLAPWRLIQQAVGSMGWRLRREDSLERLSQSHLGQNQEE